MVHGNATEFLPDNRGSGVPSINPSPSLLLLHKTVKLGYDVIVLLVWLRRVKHDHVPSHRQAALHRQCHLRLHMPVIHNDVELEPLHLRHLDVHREGALRLNRPRGRSTYHSLSPPPRLVARRVHDVHARLLLPHTSLESIRYSTHQEALRVLPVPYHNVHLLTQLQQRSARAAMEVLQTHHRRRDVLLQDRELLLRVRVVAHQRVRASLRQDETPVDGSLYTSQQNTGRTQHERRELGASHVPVVANQAQVPVTVRVLPEPRLAAVLVGLVHAEDYSSHLGPGLTRVGGVDERDGGAVVEEVHQVVVVAGSADHHVVQRAPRHRALGEDEVVLRVRLEEVPATPQLVDVLVLTLDGVRNGTQVTLVVVHTTSHDEHLRVRSYGSECLRRQHAQADLLFDGLECGNEGGVEENVAVAVAVEGAVEVALQMLHHSFEEGSAVGIRSTE